MKRIALLLLSLFVLVGCTTKMPSLDTGFKQGLSKPVSQSTNHKKRFMRYYTPPHVDVKKADTNSTLFTVEGFDVLMRLSIDKIVSENFDYDKKSETEKTQDPVFEDSASYIDIQDETRNMKVRIYKMNEYYAIFLNNESVDMLALVPGTNVSITLESMVDILKTVVINKDVVVSAYSNKEISNYDSTYSEFFEQTPPETGTLKDMYEQLNPNRD